MVGNGIQAPAKFVNARDEENLKYMKIRFWVSSDKNWFYFIYLNPCLVLTAAILSLTKAPVFFILIDALFIFFVSYTSNNHL